MDLRDYQWEVIEPALEGKNIIIWLPTGSGKTRAAVYVTKRHLQTTHKAKVAVLVNKVSLVEQHYTNEFNPHLMGEYNVIPISGDSDERILFAQVVKDNDVIICTAQILQNALTAAEEGKHVELTDFTLLVIDECHHTHKDGVYNKLMESYTEKKLKGEKKLPQILGLTASPGTGGAKTSENAEKHILQLCANLDTWKIMSAKVHLPELEERTRSPRKEYQLTEQRPLDPFGDKLKDIMVLIHTYLNDDDIFRTEPGTQVYEQKLVELEKKGAMDACRKKRVCALHLRKYNDALLIHDAVRMIDAFNILDDFYINEIITKTQHDPTEQFLIEVFDENRQTLSRLANDDTYQNPKLQKLEDILKEHFGKGTQSRGIIFTSTRQSSHSLHEWVCTSPGLAPLALKTAALTGAGLSSQTKHMTQNEQQEVIQDFRNGKLNLLVSTSVAEEGLDIPECNIVIRYGRMTNVVGMIRARGHARAPDSVYSVLAKHGSKEERREQTNEILEDLMSRAIEVVQAMPEANYRRKIRELQMESIVFKKMKKLKINDKKNTYRPEDVLFYCRNCNESVAHGDDLRTIEHSHHVNIKPEFKIYYTLSRNPIKLGRKFDDWEPGKMISCHCGQKWGMEMLYKGLNLPAISVEHFVVQTSDGMRKQYKKWKDVPFAVEELDFDEAFELHFANFN